MYTTSDGNNWTRTVRETDWKKNNSRNFTEFTVFTYCISIYSPPNSKKLTVSDGGEMRLKSSFIFARCYSLPPPDLFPKCQFTADRLKVLLGIHNSSVSFFFHVIFLVSSCLLLFTRRKKRNNLSPCRCMKLANISYSFWGFLYSVFLSTATRWCLLCFSTFHYPFS